MKVTLSSEGKSKEIKTLDPCEFGEVVAEFVNDDLGDRVGVSIEISDGENTLQHSFNYGHSECGVGTIPRDILGKPYVDLIDEFKDNLTKIK